jgi:phenol hydroxylase P0 protein
MEKGFIMNKVSPFEKKYVHVTDIKNNGLIEFDFAVGDPCMYVELALPKKQFEEFCLKNDVMHLTREQEIDVENDKYKWQYGVVGTLTK